MTKKIFFWKLKDGTLNAFKEKELLNYVGRIIKESNLYLIQDIHDVTTSTHKSLKEAKTQLRRIAKHD